MAASRRLPWLVALAIAVGFAVLRVSAEPRVPARQVAVRRDLAHAVRTAPVPPHLEVPAPRLDLPDEGLRLEGRVVDDTGDPVAGARVSVGDRETVSEADGAFGFDDLPAGVYHVRAELGDRFAEDPRVGLEEMSDPVVLRLVRGPTVIVHVIDERGAPVAGATVTMDDRSLMTPRDGVLRFRAVPVGEALVDVRADGHGTLRLEVMIEDGPLVDITLTLGRGAPLSGEVVDLAGHPVRSGWVEASCGDTTFRTYLNVEDAGTFSFGDLGTCRYTLYAGTPTHVSVDGGLEVFHDGTRATTGVRLVVEPGAEIEGVVVDLAGRPLVDVTVATSPARDTRTDVHGSFLLTGLPPGDYDVSASSRVAGAPAQHVELARRHSVRLRFVLVASSLAGVVVDRAGAPVDGARVSAVNGNGELMITPTDELGHFDFGGVPPGGYRVTAQRGDDGVDGAAVAAETPARNLRIVAP